MQGCLQGKSGDRWRGCFSGKLLRDKVDSFFALLISRADHPLEVCVLFHR